MRRSLFGKTVRDHLPAVAGWSLGLALLALYLTYLYPFIQKASGILAVIDRMPPIIKNLVGQVSLATPEGFFSIQPFSIFAPLLFLLFAVANGCDTLAGEEERGTLALLLTYPISRPRVVLEKFAAFTLHLIVLTSVFWAAMALGVVRFRIALNQARLAQAMASCFLLGWFFLALAMAAAAGSGRRKSSLAGVGGFAVVTYLINAYAPMVAFLRPYRVLSPFYFYNGAAPLQNGLRPTHALVLLLAALVLLTAATLFLQRRDIH